LPRGHAAETFAPIIARLPFDRSQSSDDLTISRQLVELLPEQQRAASTACEPVDARGKRRYRQAMILLACLALTMAVLSGLL
jgi:hypothetical protein